MSFQTWLFLQQNAKQDTLRNVGNQTMLLTIDFYVEENKHTTKLSYFITYFYSGKNVINTMRWETDERMFILINILN